jgi:iron(III) transport system ATP-binding protein
VAVLGPSGCGKTTLLRLIAGFERPSAGRVSLDGRTVSDDGVFIPPEDRRIGIVFQSYALWPHMDVAGNVGYPLAVKGVRGEDKRRLVAEALASVGLTGFETRAPGSLSGGQRQRVALARCLAMAPELVLLDEPLANLDPHLKASLLDEIADFRRKTGAALVYITHDQGEAMALADRIAVMQAGRILQLAPPATLYREPATEFVARFVGGGGLTPVRVLDGSGMVELGGHQARMRMAPGQGTGDALACLRPEDVSLADQGPAAAVIRVQYHGGRYLVELRLDDGSVLTMDARPGAVPEAGTAVHLAFQDGWVIPNS